MKKYCFLCKFRDHIPEYLFLVVNVGTMNILQYCKCEWTL